MSHEQHETTDPFWTHDVPLAEGVHLHTGLHGPQPQSVCMRMHLSEETYPRGHGHSEIVPIGNEPGKRAYLLAHLYLLVPDITLEVGLYDRPTTTGAIGEVIRTHLEGTRSLQIGSGQAWFYMADKTLVLWELIVADHVRPSLVPLADDDIYLALWRAFERQLLTLFPEATQIATPSWDPDYPTDQWHRLLTSLGYTPATSLAYTKPVRRPALDTQAATT